MLITSKAVKKEYEKRTVLDVSSLQFEKGKVYAVMGANGSGKSTLAKAYALEKGIEGVSIGYMPQKNYPFRMSVLKNVMLTAESEEKAVSILKRLGLFELKDSNAKKLSGGETAKLALARVLSKKFELLILDEPTAAMDVESTFESEKLIKEYAKDTGAAVIIITHSKGQAERISDELIFLSHGLVLEKGDTKTILTAPSTKEASLFFSL